MSEIRIFAGNFAPLQWAFCDGSLMSIAENTALFSLLGTTYGGDGQTTFALPDLRSRIPVGTGQGAGLSNWDLGQVTGVEAVTLTNNNLPSHTHTLTSTLTATYSPQCNSNASGGSDEVTGKVYGGVSNSTPMYAAPPANTNMKVSNGTITGNLTVSPAGGSVPHSNIQPVIAMNYIICVEGIYPSRN